MVSLTNPSVRRAAGLLALGAFTLTAVGCFGRFPLTRASYEFNREISDDKYVRSIAFWPLTFMHAGAALADILIINPMEFWSGERVVREASLPDGTTVKAVADSKTGPLQLIQERDGKVLNQHLLVSLGDGRYEVRNMANQYLGTVKVHTDGTLQVI